MKRIVVPHRWSEMNRVEHPPLMMKQLFQGVCGGLRWLETKSLAQYLAVRAIEEGYPSTPGVRKALHVKRAPLQKRRVVQRSTKSATAACSLPTTAAPAQLPLTSSGDALTVTGGLSLQVTKQKRLVSYDVLDCTLGSGYHAGAVLENGGPYTRVVALDCDHDAMHAARDLVEEFGGDRFRFYCCKMSEAKAMFGERSFDAIMIDGGVSDTQLEDPERGFLLDDEGGHRLDMRFGPQMGVGALEYLNTVSQHTLVSSLLAYGLLEYGQAMKMSRAITRRKPFVDSREVLTCIEQAGDELPEGGWRSQGSRRKSPMSWKFLTSLRCIINNEMYELRQGIENALLMLRDDGRLVVFSRLPWEERLVRGTVDDHPHALLSYVEDISIDDVQIYGFTRHAKMWVITRAASSAYALKNTTTLTEEKFRESSVRWLTGMYAGQTHGFPANNFTFENFERKEWVTLRRNGKPPPVDVGLDDK
uniref:mt-SAF14 n=1 Tax=Trypanosoma brucei brucei TaxID=5702 RepID=UPI00122C1314|nr:Chain FF, mt-SAF14 [Trypanosoma brucei brucei]6SGA_FF Chain FF, mt-SAF14 [Trypanosoma brucei brucei]6SGB_FF Chain FF, mt-SAF14 [Trypanosoma brucei brucei]